MQFFALILVVLAAIIGPSAVVCSIGYATIKALARNPSSSPVLLMGMLVILIFNEAVVILSLLVFFLVFKRL